MSRQELSATMHSGYGSRISKLIDPESLPALWRNTPIEELIGAHNFDKPIESGDTPQLLIVSCIEYRFSPQVPHSFAYVARKAGSRLIGEEFSLAYTVAKGVKHIALIGHNDCGMTKVNQAKPALIEALVSQGWDKTAATLYVNANAPSHMIGDELESLEQEYLRLRSLFKKVLIAPLFVSIASSHLHIPNWYAKYAAQAGKDEDTDTPVSLDKIAELLRL
ncbi:MAG: hypothetical protein K2X77_03940 [Candidatus Obscuribacterales bacterium]|nr:hypothetical protein [Candidatus Obscuribacterales bacterium]